MYQLIRADLILEPRRSSRKTMGEVELADLVDSIRAVGLIEPLVVEPEGGKFRTLAGHRRLVACKALDFAEIPCIVRQPGTVAGAAITSHENRFREDLNPAEEAHYFKGLLEEECQGDVDQLCAMVRHTRNYCEGRLLLLGGDPRVFEELTQGRVTIGVAEELNRVEDPGMRLVYLDAAVKGGATVTMVREWRVKSNMLYGANSPTAPDAAPEGVAALPAPAATMNCFICDDADDFWEMELLYVHRRCRKIMLDRLFPKAQVTP